MSRLRVISPEGDRTVMWERDRVEAGDPEAKAAVKEAERIFTDARARGGVAFKVETGKPGERIDAFDEKAEQIVVVPRMAGG